MQGALPLLESLVVGAHKHPVWEDFDTLTWVIVGVAALISIWVVWKAVRYTMRPGETEADHIKRSILEEPAQISEIGLEVTLSSEDPAGSTRPAAPPADGA